MVKVQVANRDGIYSEKRCLTLKFKLQGTKFVTKMHVLILTGCNIVLGV